MLSITSLVAHQDFMSVKSGNHVLFYPQVHFVWAPPLQCRVGVPATCLWGKRAGSLPFLWYISHLWLPICFSYSQLQSLQFHYPPSATDVHVNSIYLYKGFCLPPKKRKKKRLYSKFLKYTSLGEPGRSGKWITKVSLWVVSVPFLKNRSGYNWGKLGNICPISRGP